MVKMMMFKSEEKEMYESDLPVRITPGRLAGEFG
jgi:hypothetical protein